MGGAIKVKNPSGKRVWIRNEHFAPGKINFRRSDSKHPKHSEFVIKKLENLLK